MEQLQYIVEDSTIAEILGIQNFTNKEAAVFELVKNAYDAHATELRILIHANEMILSDNGHGMNQQIIRSYWMHVGKSPKGYKEEGRVLAGSKGIGRFALARLGGEVVIESHHKNDVPVRWKTDWSTCTIETIQKHIPLGTSIHISRLRDKWNTKSIEQLRDFLSRAYAESGLRITIQHEMGQEVTIAPYFDNLVIGENYLSRIELQYDNTSQTLRYTLFSDEFQDGAQDYCKIDIKYHEDSISVCDELSTEKDKWETEEIQDELLQLGPFTATFYFQYRALAEDLEKFLYKDHLSVNRRVNGIILYRNAFSIAGYDGKKDWIELGKRSRRSPAAASHPTGAWRVRENQLAGMVCIDKKKNNMLQDLSNRQGIEDNLYYRLFIRIIEIGISAFERYRQEIIRSINKKNANKQEEKSSPTIEKVLSNPKELSVLNTAQQQTLVKEIIFERNQNKQQYNNWIEAEQRYRYDIRLLNVLATLGLRSSSMAHEMNNDRNEIAMNCENIINALIYFGYWDDLKSSERTRVKYRNVPELLQVAQRVESKMVSFMDVMLTEIEKQKFVPKNNNIASIIDTIKKHWENDYAWIHLSISCSGAEEFWIAEDILISIFDNLILNSVQQNSGGDYLAITLNIKNSTDRLSISYADNGVGLVAKYRANPRRILEVHESSRKDGHGLGMWIVNNSINYTGGEIINIAGEKGFIFEFSLGRNS